MIYYYLQNNLRGILSPFLINNMCLYPKTIENRKYLPNKKNGGIVPTIKDIRTKYVQVECGNCIECRKKKARDWQVRLNEELRANPNCYFMTMTYSEQDLYELTLELKKTKKYHISEENQVAILSVRRFLERWRKKYKKSLKHWLITELGHTGTERIHLHGIIWSTPEVIDPKTGEIETFENEIRNIWKYGLTDTGLYVNEKTINYIVKYMTKIDVKHKGYKAKVLCSPGLGKGYLERIDKKINKFNGTETKEHYRTKNGTKLALPNYYRQKLYTDEQREFLWIDKMNKEQVFICGEKIDTSNSLEPYYRTLDFYRKKNKILGYGDDSEEYEVKSFIKERRRDKKRIQQTKKKKT